MTAPTRAGSQAAYLVVANELAERFRRSPPGTQVDSEHQLAAEFGINRLTAREALRELERRLLVRREAGRGTFTTYRIDYRVELGGAASFRKVVEQAGHRVDVIELPGHEPAGPHQHGPDGELVITRVSRVDGFIAAYGVDRFPAAVAARLSGHLGRGTSIDTALRAAGFGPRRASVQVLVEVPPAEIAVHLGFANSAPPTWHLCSVTVDTDGTVLDRSDGWLRTDVFNVSVHVNDRS